MRCTTKVPETKRTRLRREIIKAHRHPPKEREDDDGMHPDEDGTSPQSKPLMSGGLTPLPPNGQSMPAIRPATPGGEPQTPGAESHQTLDESVFSDDRTVYSDFKKKLAGRKAGSKSATASYALYTDRDKSFDAVSAHSMHSLHSGYSKHDTTVMSRMTLRLPKNPERITCCDQVFLMLGIIAYILDIASDIWVAVAYYSAGHLWWFVATLLFFLIPHFLTTIISIVFHSIDLYLERKLSKLNGKDDLLTNECLSYRTAGRIICQILLLSPLIRGMEAFTYGCFSRSTSRPGEERRRLFLLTLDEKADYALLRLFLTFLEAAPQLCLQMYLMTVLGMTGVTWLVAAQSLSILTSLVSLSVALVQYQDAVRRSHDTAAFMPWCGYILCFWWRFLTVLARLTAFALFTAYFQFWVFIVIIFHWVLMLLWTMCQNTVYCSRAGAELGCGCLEYLFRVAVSLILIVSYIDLLPDRTRLRYFVYYVLVFLENVSMVAAWYALGSTTSRHVWFHAPALLAVLLGYFMGITFQIIFYAKCHPRDDYEDYYVCQWISPMDLTLVGPPMRETMRGVQDEEKAKLEMELEAEAEREEMLHQMSLAAKSASNMSIGYPSAANMSQAQTPVALPGQYMMPPQDMSYGPQPNYNMQPMGYTSPHSVGYTPPVDYSSPIESPPLPILNQPAPMPDVALQPIAVLAERETVPPVGHSTPPDSPVVVGTPAKIITVPSEKLTPRNITTVGSEKPASKPENTPTVASQKPAPRSVPTEPTTSEKVPLVSPEEVIASKPVPPKKPKFPPAIPPKPKGKAAPKPAAKTPPKPVPAPRHSVSKSIDEDDAEALVRHPSTQSTDV